jgi:large subunit ribosomal protein L17
MRHLNGKNKLNMKESFRRAFLRNQVIDLINYGHITTTLSRAKETRKLVDKVVTIAAKGNTFNARRRVKQLLPYNESALVKLFTEVAPNYSNRPGGYTRILRLGARLSDTSLMARLQWV